MVYNTKYVLTRPTTTQSFGLIDAMVLVLSGKEAW